jgi:hypothetical protein
MAKRKTPDGMAMALNLLIIGRTNDWWVKSV